MGVIQPIIIFKLTVKTYNTPTMSVQFLHTHKITPTMLPFTCKIYPHNVGLHTTTYSHNVSPVGVCGGVWAGEQGGGCVWGCVCEYVKSQFN